MPSFRDTESWRRHEGSPGPDLGSWSIVDLTGEDGSVRRLAIVHPDEEMQAIARELKEGWPPGRDDPFGLPAVARTGRSEVVEESRTRSWSMSGAARRIWSGSVPWA